MDDERKYGLTVGNPIGLTVGNVDSIVECANCRAEKTRNREQRIADARSGAERFAFLMAQKQAMPLVDPMVDEAVAELTKQIDGEETDGSK